MKITNDDAEQYSPRGRGGAWLAIILNLFFWGCTAVMITRCNWTKPPVSAQPPCDAETFGKKLALCSTLVRLECEPCEAPAICSPCPVEDECNAWAEKRRAQCNGDAGQ